MTRPFKAVQATHGTGARLQRSSGLAPFVPALLRGWLAEDATRVHHAVDGTLAIIDISGFTRLTEQLAARGKVGAEEITEILDAVFSELLELARGDGAYLVKWAGDAVVLLFDGEHHAARAARTACRMRARLRRAGSTVTPSGSTRLRMSVGIHSGRLSAFLVGDPTLHRELIVCGPTATRTAEVQCDARPDEIRLSHETADLLPPACVDRVSALPLLVRAPHAEEVPPRRDVTEVDESVLLGVLPPSIRDYLSTEELSAEHRKVAVGFVRFSGTDDLLARHGVEQLAAALEECVELVQQAAQRHGVTFLESDVDVNGARIMLVAGAPRSTEHNEDRLLRTAQHILATSTPLPVRIGLGRGPVFTGVLGPSFCRTYSVKGDAVNVAARLAASAGPGEALVTAATLTHAGGRFAHDVLPSVSVRGKAAPIEVARLGDSVRHRLGSIGGEGELTGRESELAALRAAVDAALEGEGHLVEIVGEPGIGKTRLLHALLADLQVPSYLVSCDEYETLTPYWPFRSLLVSALRLPAGSRTDAAGLQRAVGARDATLLPWVPLLAKVLDLEVPSTPEVDALDERFRQAKLQQVTVRCLTAVLPERTVLAFEDVHLMDDASAGLLDRLCHTASTRSQLVVVTRRDVAEGFRPEHAGVSMRLAPLDATAAARLAQLVGASEQLPRPVIDAAVERAQGNPLFLRGLLHASIMSGAGVLPETVEALISSELDRLPPAERKALRYASVLGVRFERRTLHALLGGGALPSSVEAGRRMAAFMRSEGDSFRFVHQLVRDTAYETLPYRSRRALHGAAGDILEAQATRPDEIAEVLSLHFGQADRPDKAWHYSRIGGERAAGKYAYAQAEELFTRALQAARHVRRIRTEDLVATNVALGDARFRLGRQQEALEPYRAARRALAHDPVKAALLLLREAEIEYRRGQLRVALGKLTRARRMLSETKRSHRAALARIEAFYAIAREGQGRYRDALEWARRAEKDARSSGDLAARAEALQAVFSAQAMLGDTSHAASAREAIGLYERLGDRAGQSRALNNLAMLAWLDGRGVEALDMFRQAQRLATDAGDAVKAAAAEYNVGDVLLRIGRVEEARDLFSELVPVLRSVGLEEYAATACRALGTAMVLTGRHEDGADLLRRARMRLRELGDPAEVLETDAATAWTALETGNPGRASRIAGQAAQRAEALDVVQVLPWLLRLHGAALADLAQPALETLERARALAEMHNRVELGFVLAELSRLYRRDGSTELAAEHERAATTALARLGFVGSPRYPAGVTSP